MILLGDSALDRLVEQSRDAAPEEACGVLAGTVRAADSVDVLDERGRVEGIRDVGADAGSSQDATVVKRVERVFPCTNADEKPEWRYTIDPSDQIDAFRTIDEEDLDLIGFYHSHPRGPRGPSEMDLDRATWDDRSYVIVSLDGEEPWVGAWLYTGEAFEEERIVVTA